MKIAYIAGCTILLTLITASSTAAGVARVKPTPPQQAAMIASYNAASQKDDRCTQAGYSMRYYDFHRAAFTWSSMNVVCLEPVRYGYDSPIFHHNDAGWKLVFIRTFNTGPPPCRLTPRLSVLAHLGFRHCTRRNGSIVKTA